MELGRLAGPSALQAVRRGDSDGPCGSKGQDGTTGPTGNKRYRGAHPHPPPPGAGRIPTHRAGPGPLGGGEAGAGDDRGPTLRARPPCGGGVRATFESHVPSPGGHLVWPLRHEAPTFGLGNGVPPPRARGAAPPRRRGLVAPTCVTHNRDWDGPARRAPRARQGAPRAARPAGPPLPWRRRCPGGYSMSSRSSRSFCFIFFRMVRRPMVPGAPSGSRSQSRDPSPCSYWLARPPTAQPIGRTLSWSRPRPT